MISPAFAYSFIHSKGAYRCVYRNESESPLIRPFVCVAEVVLETPWNNKNSLDVFDSRWILDYLDETFGGTCIISPKDTLIHQFLALEDQGLVDLRMMECASPECFANVVYEDIDPVVYQKSGGMIRVSRIALCPDSMGYTYAMSARP